MCGEVDANLTACGSAERINKLSGMYIYCGPSHYQGYYILGLDVGEDDPGYCFSAEVLIISISSTVPTNTG